MNNTIILTIITSFLIFSSCNTEVKKEETYLYHDKIKEKVMEFQASNTSFKLCMVSEGKRDTIIINSENLETRLKPFFIDGVISNLVSEYNRVEYKKDGYDVVELCSNNKKHKVKRLLYKENLQGDFYYVMHSSGKNRLATNFTNISFSSKGDFLIISDQEVPFSYSTNYRVEGKPVAN